ALPSGHSVQQHLACHVWKCVVHPPAWRTTGLLLVCASRVSAARTSYCRKRIVCPLLLCGDEPFRLCRILALHLGKTVRRMGESPAGRHFSSIGQVVTTDNSLCLI